jgi:peroxiredoxin
LQSTPSSADSSRGRSISRGAVVALIVVSLAIPAAILALILARDDSPSPASTAPTSTVPVPEPRRARIGKVAPDFTLPALDGRSVTLSSYRGRPVLLAFFASWCHPCEEDMPALERAQRDAGGRIAVVGVNYQDIPADTRDFVNRLGVTFPTLIEDSADNPVAKRYDVHEMPDTVFIDATGVVRNRLWGPVSSRDIDKAVETLLQQGAGAARPSG